MTALTTIIGMIPLTFSEPSRLGISYKSFGLTLIGGMTTATLLVVPAFYAFFDDVRIAMMRTLRRAFWQRRATSSVHDVPVAPSLSSSVKVTRKGG